MEKRNNLFIFITIISLFMILPSTVNAKVYGGKFTRGISRVSYYIDYKSGTGYYERLIIDAEHNWENPGWPSSVNMVAASSNKGTMLDIYTTDKTFWGGSTNILGETFFYDSKGKDMGVPYSQNYIFTRIYLNDTAMHNYSATKDRHVIIHEMGHAFGLDHNINANSIMYPEVQGCNVDYVQQMDINDVNNLYK